MVPGELGTQTPDETTPFNLWANGPYASTWPVDPISSDDTPVNEQWYIAKDL